MSNKKRILVSPLDWGLGHATRCIPIIRQLLKRDVEVLIGADQGPLALLHEEFPNLPSVEMFGYNIKYPKYGGNMALRMVFSAPKILKKIKQEHKQLLDIIKRYNINGVISDNRYGLYTRKVPTVFITHQLHVQTSLMKERVYHINKKYIEKYTECWVPDYQGQDNLSGNLAHHHRKIPKNVYYINPISRFGNVTLPKEQTKYDMLVVLSGPEPQRTIFEENILTQVSELGLKTMIVRGKPKELNKKEDGQITVVNHLGISELSHAMLQSKLVLCRSGYSSLMDLAVLGKKAILVPTPGQTEQKYLAKYHHAKNHYFYMSQRDFNLRAALTQADNFSGLKIPYNEDALEKRIDAFLNRC